MGLLRLFEFFCTNWCIFQFCSCKFYWWMINHLCHLHLQTQTCFRKMFIITFFYNDWYFDLLSVQIEILHYIYIICSCFMICWCFFIKSASEGNVESIFILLCFFSLISGLYWHCLAICLFCLHKKAITQSNLICPKW